MGLKKKTKINKTEINNTLNSIYRDKDGKKISMRVQKAPSTSGKKILIGFIGFFALIALVSWLGVLFFSGFNNSGSDKIEIEIRGDKSVEAGEEVEYEVVYRNKEEVPVASAEIGLYLPKSFVLSETNPVLGDKKILKLGTLESGKIGTLKFKGRFFATDGEKQIIQIVLNYKPSNFNSNFQKVADLEVTIKGSGFDGSLDGPDKVIVGEDIVYKLTYKNKSNETLDNVAIDLVLPDEFIVATTTPAIDRNNRWNIGKLEAKSEGTVEVKGSFAVDSKGDKDILLKLGVVDEEGALLSLIEKNITTEVVGSDFSINMLLNGANNFNSARWGDSLNYSIVFKNEGKEKIYNVKIKLTILGLPKENGQSIVDWTKLTDAHGGKIEGDTITWTKDGESALAQIDPGEEGLIDFSLGIIPKPNILSYRDYKIDSSLETEIERVGNVAVARNIQSPKVTVFINSDTKFNSSARYYNDANAIIGSGPIPPKVGQKTTYTVYWNVSNSMHELENIEVSANLPENVIFSNGNTEAGTIALDGSFKKVIWSLNRLPISVNSIRAEFNITLTPTAEDVGNVLGLLESITFKAKDNSTGGTITLVSGDETTALPDDPFVTKGQIEE